MIFHHLQILFVGIPKNGSTSVWKSLYDPSLPQDGESNTHNHEGVWVEDKYHYQKVCMVRNPYDRVQSSYKMFGGGVSINQKLKSFVDMGMDKFLNNELHWRPQGWFIDNKMDTILKLENPSDWESFMKTRVEGMIRPLSKENVSRIESVELDDESIQMINYLYRDDFHMFNYKMR